MLEFSLSQAMIEDNIGCGGRKIHGIVQLHLGKEFLSKIVYIPCESGEFLSKNKRNILGFPELITGKETSKTFRNRQTLKSYLVAIMRLRLSVCFETVKIRLALKGNIIKAGKRAQHNERLFQRNKIFLLCFSKMKILNELLICSKAKFTKLPSIIEVFKWLFCP